MPLIAPPNGPTAANKAKAAICILSGVICAATPFVMPLKAEVISLSVLQWYLSVAFGMYGMRAQLARPRRPRPLPSPRVHAHARALSRAHGAPSPTPTPSPRVRPGVQFLLVPRVVIDLNFDVKPDKYHLFMSRARTTCHFAWTTLLSLTRFACTPTLSLTCTLLLHTGFMGFLILWSLATLWLMPPVWIYKMAGISGAGVAILGPAMAELNLEVKPMHTMGVILQPISAGLIVALAL